VTERPGAWRILVHTPNWVGDVVMATPAFRAVRDLFGKAHITFLARSYLHELLQPAPWYNELISADPAQTLLGLRQLARELAERRFTLAILFPNSFRSSLLVWWAGIPRRVGYARSGRTLLLTEQVQPLRGPNGAFLPRSMVSYYLELVDYLGGDISDRRLHLYVDKQARASLHELLSGRGYDPARPTIVFIPGAKFGASKCWPPRYFSQLADQLLSAQAANLVVVCAPGEEPIGEAIEQLSPPGVIHLWREPLGLGRLKALIAESHLVVTNDTGPRHIAAAFDVPVVTIFGPTDPQWTDTGHKKEVLLKMTGLDCMPCQLPVCPRKHECLEQLLPEQVFGAATELLRRFPPKPAAAAGPTRRGPAEQTGRPADPAGRPPTAP